MATNPRTRLGLTRDQLAAFLKDHEQIKQFENLFTVVDAIAPDVVNETKIEVETAQATAKQALVELAVAVQELTTNAYAAQTQAAQAIQAIDAMQQQIDMLAIAQPLQTLSNMQQQIDMLSVAPPPQEFKRARYGSFYDTTTQTAAAINTAYAMTFNATDLSVGVRLRSPSTSEVEVDTEGVYNIQFSAQMDNTSGGNHLVYIWLRVNGTNVANSASQVRLKSTDGELVPSWNFFYSFKARDYFQVMWSVSDVAVQITAQAAAPPVPAIPSVILTVNNNIQGVQ